MQVYIPQISIDTRPVRPVNAHPVIVQVNSITLKLVVTLISPRSDSIKIGDLLHYHIITSNVTDSGGEFYSATLASVINPRASTAGHMVDHSNGTYSVYFYAGWVGQATLSITRVLTREAVTFIEKDLWDADDRVVWQGYFKTMDNGGSLEDYNQMPKGLCRLRNHGNWTGMCEYPHTKALGKTIFICEKPPGVDCKTFFATKSDDNRINHRVMELTKGRERMFER